MCCVVCIGESCLLFLPITFDAYDVRASAAMTMATMWTGDFDDTLGEILGASFMATPSLDLDLAFGALDSNVDLAHTHLLSPLSPQ